MLIIDNKIVISHMKKCGGTSVCKGLIETMPPERLEYLGYTREGEKKSAESRRRRGLWKHSPAHEIVNSLPQPRENLTVYLVSLRPWWERVASYFFHARRYNKKGGNYKWVENMEFHDFLRSPYINDVERLDEFSANGSVDYFVGYEGLSDWYRSFAANLGYPESSLPIYNVGDSPHSGAYRDIFTDDDMEIMTKLFAGEIEMMARMRASESGLMQMASGDQQLA